MSIHKLAFVGPEIIHNAFQEMDDNWDMQIPLEKLEDLEREFGLEDEQARISKDTAVIILFSRLFDSNPQLFADLVAYSAPYSVVCILIPGKDVNKKPLIERTIKEAQLAEATENDSYNANTPFYFVDYENAQLEILEAIEAFCYSPIIDEDIKNSIKPMIPGYEEESYLDEYEENNSEENVILPQAAPDATGQVITITSSKGGSGKSTVAISLGAYLVAASKDAYEKGKTDKPLKVVSVDLDVRDGQQWLLMGAKKPPTVMDIIASGGIPTVETIPAGVWHSDKTGCDYIFAPKRPRSAKEIPASFYAQLIQALRSMYDVILLDTSVNYLDPLGEQVAYPLADKIIFVSDMGQSSVLGCTRWIQEEMRLREPAELNIPDYKVGIVINKAMPDVNMSANKIEKAVQNLPILSMIPSEPELVTYAANTAELHQILNVRLINEAIRDIAEAVLPDTPLGTVPSM